MNREECENKILEKLKEINDIVKEYDNSNERYLCIYIIDDYICCNNIYIGKQIPLFIFLSSMKAR